MVIAFVAVDRRETSVFGDEATVTEHRHERLVEITMVGTFFANFLAYVFLADAVLAALGVV